MTSETPNLHVSKNLNISKTKQDIEKLKTPLRLVIYLYQPENPQKNFATMDNLHVRLTFNLAKTNKIFYYS